MRYTLMSLIFFVLVPACGDSTPPPLEEDMAQLEQMETEIRDFVGQPVCSETPECAAVAFGSKPCGGPWSYLIYSTATVDSVELEGMVADYNAFNDIVNQRQNLASDCHFVMPPVLACVDNLCADVTNTP